MPDLREQIAQRKALRDQILARKAKAAPGGDGAVANFSRATVTSALGTASKLAGTALQHGGARVLDVLTGSNVARSLLDPTDTRAPALGRQLHDETPRQIEAALPTREGPSKTFGEIVGQAAAEAPLYSAGGALVRPLLAGAELLPVAGRYAGKLAAAIEAGEGSSSLIKRAAAKVLPGQIPADLALGAAEHEEGDGHDSALGAGVNRAAAGAAGAVILHAAGSKIVGAVKSRRAAKQAAELVADAARAGTKRLPAPPIITPPPRTPAQESAEQVAWSVREAERLRAARAAQNAREGTVDADWHHTDDPTPAVNDPRQVAAPAPRRALPAGTPPAIPLPGALAPEEQHRRAVHSALIARGRRAVAEGPRASADVIAEIRAREAVPEADRLEAAVVAALRDAGNVPRRSTAGQLIEASVHAQFQVPRAQGAGAPSAAAQYAALAAEGTSPSAREAEGQAARDALALRQAAANASRANAARATRMAGLTREELLDQLAATRDRIDAIGSGGGALAPEMAERELAPLVKRVRALEAGLRENGHVGPDEALEDVLAAHRERQAERAGQALDNGDPEGGSTAFSFGDETGRTTLPMLGALARTGAGGAAGTAYGGTQGDTPEERARNAQFYGLAGAAAGAAASPAIFRRSAQALARAAAAAGEADPAALVDELGGAGRTAEASAQFRRYEARVAAKRAAGLPLSELEQLVARHTLPPAGPAGAPRHRPPPAGIPAPEGDAFEPPLGAGNLLGPTGAPQPRPAAAPAPDLSAPPLHLQGIPAEGFGLGIAPPPGAAPPGGRSRYAPSPDTPHPDAGRSARASANPMFDPDVLRELAARRGVAAAVGAGVGATQDEDDPMEGAAAGAVAGATVSHLFGRAGARAAAGAAATAAARATERVMAAVPVTATRREAGRVVGSIGRKAGEEGAAAAAPYAGELDVHQFVNFAKFALDETGATRLAEEVERVVRTKHLAPKQAVSWETTRKIAASLGLESLTKGDAKRLSGPEMLAIRNLVSGNVAMLTKLERAQLDPTLSDAAREALRTQASLLEKQNDALLSRFVVARSQAGRDLNNLKMVARQTLDPVWWLSKAKRALGDTPLTEEHRTEILRHINAGDGDALARYVAKLATPSTWQQVNAVVKAGMLTAPTTHAANLLGNTTMAMLETAKDAPALVFDRLLGAATGLTTKNPSLRSTLAASKRGARQGWREAQAIWRDGALAGEAVKGEHPHEIDLTLFKKLPAIGEDANAFLDLYQKKVFRSLGAADRVFRQAALARSIAEQARVVAKNEGVKGAAFERRVAQLVQQPTDEMALRGIEDAELTTFTNRGRLARVGTALRRAAGPVGDVLLPFVTTPANVATRVAEYAAGGVGALPDLMRLFAGRGTAVERAAIQRRAVDRLGRQSLGAGAILAGYYLAQDGRMSGPYERGAAAETKKVTGETPNSVLVGGEWRSVERISPLGNLLVLGAALHRAAQQPDATPADVAAAGAANVGRTLRDQSFLRTLGDVDAALDDPDRAAGDVVRSQATRVVPAAVQRAARAMDPVDREQATLGDAMTARVPTKSAQLPGKVTILGDDQRHEAGATAMLDPFNSSPDRTAEDPVAAELQRTGAAIGRLKRGRTEGANAYRARQLEAGTILRATLAQTIQSAEYQQLPQMAAALVQRDPAFQGRSVREVTRELQRGALEDAARATRGEITRARAAAAAP